jgi:dCMP deaminase
MNWNEYFFKMIDVIKLKSKDPSTKVGCVITNDENTVISTGFNGFPIGVIDKNINDYGYKRDITKERYEDRKMKLMFTEHAERNAIYFASRRGIALEGCKIYITWYPCCECCRAIIQTGIKEIIIDGRNYDEDDKYWKERWKESIEVTKIMLKEAGIKITIWKGN